MADTETCPHCHGTGVVHITRIEALRSSKGLSQQAFADSVGITRAQIANIETGRSKPSVDLLVRISDQYNVGIDWLIGREERSERGVSLIGRQATRVERKHELS